MKKILPEDVYKIIAKILKTTPEKIKKIDKLKSIKIGTHWPNLIFFLHLTPS